MRTLQHKLLQKLAATVAALVLLFSLSASAQTVIRSNILKITERLQQDDQVHFGYPVGFSGKPEINNKYYKLYKRLKAKATTEELVALNKHRSPIIVVYAFDILQSRNYEGLKTIFLDHVSDTTWYWTASGCTGSLNRVNWFMLRRLKPTNDEKRSMTRSEYDLYCSKFEEEDELFSCY